MYKNFVNDKIILFGISYRCLIFVLLVYYPFFHNSFGYISPLSYQEFADLNFYKNFGELEFALSNFYFNYYNLFTLNFDDINNRFPGPLFPLILFLTNYSHDFTILMAAAIFLSELFAYLIWSKKFSKLNSLSLLIFSIMPIPLYFGFLHSTDVIFYLLFTLLYFEFCSKIRLRNITVLFFFILILRPNSGLVFFSSFVYFLLTKENIKLIFVSLIFLIISIAYYGPYFFYEIEKIHGLNLIDNESQKHLLGFFYEYIKKFFFVFGFVPSDSKNIYFYLLRCFCASIFLIGFLNMLLTKKKLIDIIFIVPFIFFTVTLFFPAYRYILPITPILIFYFCLFVFKKKFKKNI